MHRHDQGDLTTTVASHYVMQDTLQQAVNLWRLVTGRTMREKADTELDILRIVPAVLPTWSYDP